MMFCIYYDLRDIHSDLHPVHEMFSWLSCIEFKNELIKFPFVIIRRQLTYKRKKKKHFVIKTFKHKVPFMPFFFFFL